MKFEFRRDQFSYILGYADKQSGRALKNAIQLHKQLGYEDPIASNVFEHCPYNADFEHVRRSIHIFENSKKASLAKNLLYVFEEFMFLASDFEPSCCYDGRTIYCKTTPNKIVLQCDRCGKLYNLDEKPIDIAECKRMEKKDFIGIYGLKTEKMWPDHSLLLALKE